MNKQTVSDRSGSRFKAFQNRFRGRSRPFREPFQKRPWNEKAARNAENNRHAPVKRAVNTVLLAGCFTGTLAELPWNAQVCFYLGALAVFLATDPLEMLTRFLAPQSRYILSVIAVMVILVVIQPEKPFMVIVGGIASAGITAVHFFNQSWLASYNWLMSAAVQQALLIDADNKAVQAWKTHGRRETRTLLYELGYEATDDLLDILHRPVYLAGYLNGYEKTVKYKSRLEAAETAAERGKEYQKQLQELQRVDQENTEALLEVKQLLQEEEANSIYWRKLYQQETKENQQLREINNELVQSLPNPEEIVKHTEQIEQQENQSVEERIMAALEAGMSYAEAGKLAGVSKSTAYRIRQQAEQARSDPHCSLSVQNENIITIGKAAGET